MDTKCERTHPIYSEFADIFTIRGAYTGQTKILEILEYDSMPPR